ncbi:hypothetical protein, partial [Dialister hominis]|uniref:hypothetical protein n=2 Tax=Dialister hominis TaxID=2582419 RepID=UPI003FD6D4EF
MEQASKIRNKCLGIPLEYALAYHEKVLAARMKNGLSASPSAGSSWFLMLETGDFCNRKKGCTKMITHFGTAPFVWVYPIRELADISGLREMKTIKPDFVRGNQPYPPRSGPPSPSG